MMMLKKRPNRRELYERILGIDKARTKATKRIENELQKLYDDYFARVKALINSPKVLKVGEATTLESTTKMIGQLSTILHESGFDDVIEGYLDQFDHLAKTALDYYTAFGALSPSFAGISTETLDAYVRFTETELRNFVPRKVIAPIQSALLQVNYGNLERTAVYEQVAAIETTITTTQAVVLVDDAFASFQRAVLQETATALDLGIFLYLGPDDDITSEQCEHMLHVNEHGVEGMLYKDEITIDLHPKLTRNPLIGGGHPRCRHHWSPVTNDFAASMGFELEKEAA